MATAAASDVPAAQFTALVLMSKTGSGKSSLANVLFDSKDFEVGQGFESETKQCQGQMKFVRGRHLLVVDTPGTMDVKDPTMPQRELLHALNNCPMGIDAFLILLRADNRFTNEELRAIQESVDVFGLESYKRAIVVFSHGDEFDNDVEAFKKMLQKSRANIPGLNDLLNRFDNRFLLMDNGKKCDQEFKEQQVAALLGLVDQVGRLNPKKYDKNDLDSQTQQRNHEKEEAERKKREKKERREAEFAEMRAELRHLSQRFRDTEIRYVSEPRRGYGPVTELLTDVGSTFGAVMASPVAGAAGLFERVLG